MGTIPFSNPAGNNGYSPKASPIMARPVAGLPGSPSAGPGSNPFTPVTFGQIPQAPNPLSPGNITGTGGASVANPLGLTPTTNTELAGGTASLQKQLTDIFGQGVGGALDNLLKNMSGVDSATLQEFINSLQPQEAKASANIGASLGAAGIGANSSVNAIAQADLQSQEFATISGESASLTQSQQDLTSQILESVLNPAQKEVATSGWSVFADVMNNITGDIGNLSGGSFNRNQGKNQGQPQPTAQNAPVNYNSPSTPNELDTLGGDTSSSYGYYDSENLYGDAGSIPTGA